MTIKELDRPSTGGQWCGSAWGYTVYYSETTSLNLTLQLYRLSEQVTFSFLLMGIISMVAVGILMDRLLHYFNIPVPKFSSPAPEMGARRG
jgi:hypothetical protein